MQFAANVFMLLVTAYLISFLVQNHNFLKKQLVAFHICNNVLQCTGIVLVMHPYIDFSGPG